MLKKLKDYDFTLIITPLLLAAFGLVMIYSASMVSAVVEGYGSTHYLIKQLQWFVLGFIGFSFCCVFPYRYYQKLVKIIILVSVVLLIGVLLFGETANNATRKLVFFNAISIQPAEFVKIGVILYLASAYSKKQSYISDFATGVLPPLALTALMLGLIIGQPDIGTTAIIFAIACSIIFSAGIRLKHLTLLMFAGLAVIAVAIPSMITDVRISRFTGAYQPFQTPDTGGYHLIQSYLAIGVGGLNGEGLGQSVQKLGYLWGAHTDFIMSIIAEELGFLGVIIVIGMFAIIVLRGLFIARKCTDTFGSLIAIGISSMVGIQAFMNLGAISGVLPITGVTLPFISYGGSSLFVLLIAMGILNNIARSVKMKEQQPMPVKTHQKIQNNPFKSGGGRPWSS
jgi:cell division protein FtsW